MVIYTTLVFLSFSIYIINSFSILKKIKPFGGYANWITFFRMLLLFYIAINFQKMPYFGIVLLFVTNILLDILDGIIARKFKSESTFGLYFDMELDAFYVCLASIILYTEGLIGSWIIFIGLLRYIFTFGMVVLSIDIQSEPKQKFASWIAGILFWCLLIPFLNTEFNFILLVASSLVVISFIKSFIFQLKSNK